MQRLLFFAPHVLKNSIDAVLLNEDLFDVLGVVT